MTPKQKSRELVDKYFLEVTGADRYSMNLDSMNLYIAKQCALIAVDEIMESNSDFAYNTTIWAGNKEYADSEIYWQQVKTEIQKL